MSGQFDLLRTKRFLPLFLTQAFGAFNDNAFKGGIIVLLTYGANSNKDALLVPLASSMLIIPMIIFSPLAGSIADKYDKAFLTKILKISEFILMVLGGMGFIIGNIYFLMSVLFLTGLQSTFFGPIKYGALPSLLKKDELIGGNALVEMSTFFAILLGMLAGSVVPSYQYGYQSLTLILCIVALVGFLASRKIPNISGDSSIKLNFNIFTGLYNSYKDIKKDGYIYLCIIAISWFWLLGAFLVAVLPNYTKIYLHSDSIVYGVLISVFAFGIAVGSLLCNKILKGSVDATFVPISGLAISILAFDLYLFTPPEHIGDLLSLSAFIGNMSSWHFMIDMFLIACFGGIYIVPLYAIIQDRAPSNYKARIIAGNNVMNSVFMTIGMFLLSMALMINISLPSIFLISAFVNLLVVIKLCHLLPGAMVRSIVRSVLHFFFKVKIKGLENLSNAGDRVVITPNHTSFLDGVLMAAYFPNKILFAIYSGYLKKWWVKPIKLFIKAFPLDTTNPFSLRSLIKEVKKEGSCIIFPEGRISVTGGLMKIYEGPGVIADKANANILPVRIEGAQYSLFSRMKNKVRLQLFPKITITVLEHRVIDIDIPGDIRGRERRRILGEKLYRIMTETFYESQRKDDHLTQSLLDARNIHSGNKIIINDISGEDWDYNKVILRSLIVSKYLNSWAKEEDIVGVFLPNTAAFAVVFFGVQFARKSAALLNYSLGPHNILSCVKAAKCNRIVTARSFIEKGNLHGVTDALHKAGYDVLYLEDLKKQNLIKEKALGMLSNLRYKINSRVSRLYDANKSAVILFTSGSEGAPKAVVLSSKNLLSNHKQMAAVIDFNPSDKILNSMPVFHAFGLNIGFLLPIIHGIEVFMYPSPLHYRIIPEIIYDFNATIFFGTNTFLSGYARYAHAYDFFSTRYVFAGAEKLLDETKKIWMDKFGIRIFEGYGATEASPVISSNTPMHYRAGTVGQLMPGIEHRIDKVDGVDEGGRLFVRGDNIMLGYYYVDTPGVLCPPVKGWHDTGDIVTIDTDGYVTIQGRAKRFAKIAGEMVSLTTVEANISLIFPEHEHAVVALPDERKGEKLILITTNENVKASDIRSKSIEQGYSDLYCPKEIIWVKQLPILGTGKIDYSACRELAEDK